MKLASTIMSLLLMVSTALGGTIDPELAATIEKSDPRTPLPTIIFMKDQLDVSAMKHQHDLIQATRAQRHRDVITALQRIATESQPDLLSYLGQARRSGDVKSYRGFWIANMIVADLTPAAIRAVAAREDVAVIYPDFKGDIIKPIMGYGDNPPAIESVERGISAIKADSMWALGFTGQGRLVCNIDTGVDGNHPALNHSWRGSNGYSPEQSWLDTSDPNNDFPTDLGSISHGTHTMGTMCGRSLTTPDTVGVAIDAQWIAAAAVDVTGGNIAAAFQWAADPDGDPNTVEDVPDVISNSWGSIGACPPDYYSLIDNCEAAGAAVLFAAGNEGPYAQSLRIPANRITTPYNCFSIGAIDATYNTFPIASFSSRGPSQCDGQTIKPEVVAPGVNVRSSVRGGSYESGWSGTSMACPHVAGAIALLRQVNPNASVDTIKWALMHSATDLPRSNPNGEDNTFGWGIINVKAAKDLIPPVDMPYLFPNAVYVVEPNDNYPDPGETISLYVRIRNSGLSANDVAAVISTSDSYATVLQDSAFYGTIAQNDTVVSSTPFRISFSPNTPAGRRVSFNFHIAGSSGYAVEKRVSLTVGRVAALATANHDVGNVGFTVSNFGQYGLAPDGMNPSWTGLGFKMPRLGTNYLFEGALFIGDGPTRVSNGARDENQNISADFQPVSAITSFEPGQFADQEHHSGFNDQGAASPLGVQITQRSFAFSAAPNNDYVIIEYVITNTNSVPLDGVLVAHFEDWDMPWGSPGDRVNFDRGRRLGYEYYGSNYRGQQVLSDRGAFSFRANDNTNDVYPPHFTLEDKWNYMNAGLIDTAITTAMDASMIITTGPYDIAAGDSVVAAFAILGGTSLTDLRANADAAIAKYATRVSVNETNVYKPDEFALSQNYPNPFNAKTTIRFNMPVAEHATLESFDLLGRRVAVLIDGWLSAGPHSVNWDCSGLPSGMYFYKLSVGDKSTVKKMTLLK